MSSVLTRAIDAFHQAFAPLQLVRDPVVGLTEHDLICLMNAAAVTLLGGDAYGKSLRVFLPAVAPDTLTPERTVHQLVLSSDTVLDVQASSVPLLSSTPDVMHGRIVVLCLSGEDPVAAHRRTLMLAEASDLIGNTLATSDMLEQIAQIAVTHMADWCSIDLITEQQTIENSVVVHRDPAYFAWVAEVQSYFRRGLIRNISGQRAIEEVSSILLEHVSPERLREITTTERAFALLHDSGVHSAICVPVVSRGRAFGVITLVLSDDNRAYTAADLALAEDLARLAGAAYNNALLYSEMQAAVLMRDRFLSIASHELKTPLTSLIGYTNLMQRRMSRGESTMTERDSKAVRVIYEQSLRLNRLVTALLDLSRIQSGQLLLELQHIDLKPLLLRIVEELQTTTLHHQLRYEPCEGPVWVLADELRLEQVFQNLIQNAVKYSPEGGSVQVVLSREHTMACVSVQDSGIGIPQASLSHLFDRFYRATNVDGQHISGMGLGLFIVREIVLLHDGSVGVVSREGEGSTFTVELPLSAPPT